MLNTRPFDVTGPWEIRWKGDLRIHVYKENGLLEETLSGKDSASYMPRGGRFFLRVYSTGPWLITAFAPPP